MTSSPLPSNAFEPRLMCATKDGGPTCLTVSRPDLRPVLEKAQAVLLPRSLVQPHWHPSVPIRPPLPRRDTRPLSGPALVPVRQTPERRTLHPPPTTTTNHPGWGPFRRQKQICILATLPFRRPHLAATNTADGPHHQVHVSVQSGRLPVRDSGKIATLNAPPLDAPDHRPTVTQRPAVVHPLAVDLRLLAALPIVTEAPLKDDPAGPPPTKEPRTVVAALDTNSSWKSTGISAENDNKERRSNNWNKTPWVPNSAKVALCLLLISDPKIARS